MELRDLSLPLGPGANRQQQLTRGELKGAEEAFGLAPGSAVGLCGQGQAHAGSWSHHEGPHLSQMEQEFLSSGSSSRAGDHQSPPTQDSFPSSRWLIQQPPRAPSRP